MRKTSLRLLGGATALATSLTLVACGGGDKAGGDFDGEVKVGILHSRSGT
ncbi:MAG: urea ABC transporter substrate-binding protein, partial [Cyanobacteria bacterium K_DeepCast_35m_m1_288]|nr:urea ABC transporter substrate-binding protein [Cyanobacteria bacterium K_DeepCast_35m_m1_288]